MLFFVIKAFSKKDKSNQQHVKNDIGKLKKLTIFWEKVDLVILSKPKHIHSSLI
jgi:hypothetical protein